MSDPIDDAQLISLAGGNGPGETVRSAAKRTAASDAMTIARSSAPDRETGTPHDIMTISLLGRPGNEAVKLRLKPCDEEFVLKSLIGKGGQGEVWEATQVDLGRVIAIKRSMGMLEEQADFMKEAFTSAQLDHPNIVPVYTLGMMDHEGTAVPVLSMKRVNGEPWRRVLLDERGAADYDYENFLRRHLQILIQVINALSYAHSKRIIHRDLKPAQVMVGEYGEVFLLDWGLAIYLDNAASTRTDNFAQIDPRRVYTLETASNPAGSPAYMAPEQAENSPLRLGIHTDVYLIGGIIYEILTGYPPHSADSVTEAIQLARENFYEPFEPEVPSEMAALATHCMATDPADRPATALEVRKKIEDYLAGSGRKIESRKLVKEIKALGDLEDYPAFSAATRKLSQADHLWPENPDVPALREDLLIKFTAHAIVENDFILARLQAGRLQDKEAAAELLEAIDAAREEASRAMPRAPLFTATRVFVLVASYVVVAAAVFYMMQTARETVIGEVESKVSSLATLGAREVSGSDVQEIIANPTIKSGAFQRVMVLLNHHRSLNTDVRFIYIFRPEFKIGPSIWRVVVDADPLNVDIDGSGDIEDGEQGNLPGDLYEDGIPEMAAAFLESRATSSYLSDEWGTFISGFAPVYDQLSGEPIALLGVDIDFDRVKAKLTMVRMVSLGGGIFLACILTGALMLFFQSRRAIAQIRLLELEIQKQNSQLAGKDIYLG